MDLKEHYNALYQKGIEKITEGIYVIDHQIDNASDNRFGITLLARPNATIKGQIQHFLDELKIIDPLQYYYPDADLHLTVMSIISCYAGFDLKRISVPDYIAIVAQSLEHTNPVTIRFQGVTLSPSALLIQGFIADDSLTGLRNNLRDNFRNSGLEQSIDKRYAIFTAHITVVRFREKIKDKDKILALLEKYRDFDFGTFKVENYDLVFNDWYQRESKVQILHQFDANTV